MELGARIAALPFADWRGWRSYGPAAGSAVAHLVLLTVIAGLMAASKVVSPALIPHLNVELLPDITPRPSPLTPQPVSTPAAASVSSGEALPVPMKRRADRRAIEKPLPPAGPPVATVTPDDAVPLPPGPADATAGLRSLMEKETCATKPGEKRGDCNPRWPNLASDGTLKVTPKVQELAKMLPQYRPPPPIPIPFMHGPGAGGHGDGGGAIMKAQGSMPMGPGAGTGIESITGRLGGGPTFDHSTTPEYWRYLPPEVKREVQQDPPSLTHN